ncbi:MAG: hypothetical protein PHN22_03745 [Candidatus ainarchaeum sp.]|nr:hypothetical protein [Candidatus ainarchaeum sp.]
MEEVKYEKIKIKSNKFKESKELIFAWIAISICFTFVLGDFNIFNKNLISNFNSINFFTLLGISLIVTGSSFILHELAHKYTAIYFGAKAQFMMWKKSLLFSIILAFILGFVFVAPGAVYIFGKRLSLKEDGIVSLAGPITNILIGFIFVLLAMFGITGAVISYGIFINFWIAFFNLIPFGPLDGKKILQWNPIIWIIMTAVPVLFLFVL